MNAGHPADRGERPDREWPEFVPVDPWAALSQVISGVVLWGLIGWGAARLLHVPALTGLGLVIGGALGVLAVYLRYGREQSGPPSAHRPVQTGSTVAAGTGTDGTSPGGRPEDPPDDSRTAATTAGPSTPDDPPAADSSPRSPADHSSAQEEKP